MPKITMNAGFQSVSGALDDVIYRKIRGQTFMTRRPDPRPSKPSPAQQKQRERFAAASYYAREILADPCQRRAYEALARDRNRRADKLLTSDFLTPPIIDEIDLSGYRGRVGDIIRVRATDDIEVVGVQVSVQTAAGLKLEEGPAKNVHGVWRYIATTALPPGDTVTIIATAKDRPGNDGVGRASYP
jgi:hypothetical protein